MAEGPGTLAEAIDVIEETYEFMLAYAAQGRRGDEEDTDTGIRECLQRAEAALGIITAATPDALPAQSPQAAADYVRNECVRAKKLPFRPISDLSVKSAT